MCIKLSIEQSTTCDSWTNLTYKIQIYSKTIFAATCSLKLSIATLVRRQFILIHSRIEHFIPCLQSLLKFAKFPFVIIFLMHVLCQPRQKFYRMHSFVFIMHEWPALIFSHCSLYRNPYHNFRWLHCVVINNYACAMDSCCPQAALIIWVLEVGEVGVLAGGGIYHTPRPPTSQIILWFYPCIHVTFVTGACNGHTCNNSSYCYSIIEPVSDNKALLLLLSILLLLLLLLLWWRWWRRRRWRRWWLLLLL